jgi:hypothetical protein
VNAFAISKEEKRRRAGTKLSNESIIGRDVVVDMVKRWPRGVDSVSSSLVLLAGEADRGAAADRRSGGRRDRHPNAKAPVGVKVSAGQEREIRQHPKKRKSKRE